MILILIIISIILFIVLVRYFLKNKRDTITCYTGGLGSGKTCLSVHDAINVFRKQRLKTFVYNLFHKQKREKPLLYSNIPIYISKHFGMSQKLEVEHVLLKKRLNERSVVLIDEIGGFASQFEYKNVNIYDNFDEFIRLYRHFTKGGYLIVNDQCSENIVLQVRRRINVINNLSKFFVVPIFHIVIYFSRKINISEEMKTILVDEEDVNNTSKLNITYWPFFFRWKISTRKRHYDTYCYSDRYLRIPEKNCISYSNKTLKINDMFTCPKTEKYDKLTNKKE